MAWRELNASHDWLEFYKEVQPLCTTLPQLVYHQTSILDALLSRLDMRYALSLEPLLDLLVHLSRDLASDFVPHFPRAVEAIERVVMGCGDSGDRMGGASRGQAFRGPSSDVAADDGAADDGAADDEGGVERDGVGETGGESRSAGLKSSNYDVSTQALHAANLRAAFAALSGMCKNLASYLVLDLRPVLKATGVLRAHRASDVRRLNGDALGYLVRRATDDVARQGIRYLVEEAHDAWSESIGTSMVSRIAWKTGALDATRALDAQRALDLCEGNGAVLASAIKGVKGGLQPVRTRPGDGV